MEFRGLEAIVVDVLRTPEIQRLRRIRQLGLGHYVFPGAEHSRLVHSLGAAWLAIRFGRQLRDSTRGYLVDTLRPSENAIADLALAALCHDLGHGPLSHAWERAVIGNGFDRAALCKTLGIPEQLQASLRKAAWHEVTTAGLLLWEDGQLHQLLEQNSKGSSVRIVRLLGGEYWLEYLPGLLSSEVDVDRADYIRRDTHQSGVAYGRYDLDWLVSTCTVGELPSGGWVVGFDARKAPRVVEQFLVARIALYETVYCHKTVRAAEGMVKNLLRRLKEVAQSGASIPGARAVTKAISGEALLQQEILYLDDFALFILIEQLAGSGGLDPVVRDLARRILSRELFKLVPVPSEKVEEYLQQEGAYERLYEAMKPFCPGDPHYYLLRDDYSVNFFSEDKEDDDVSETKHASYLIDSSRRAKPLRDHTDLKEHKRGIRSTRLFTLDSCIPVVQKTVTAKR